MLSCTDDKVARVRQPKGVKLRAGKLIVLGSLLGACKPEVVPPSVEGSGGAHSANPDDDTSGESETFGTAEPNLPCDDPPAISFTKLRLAFGSTTMGGTAEDDCLETVEASTLCSGESSALAVAVGDYDADGAPDVLFTNAYGPGRLMRNLGGGEFEDVTSSSGIDLSSPTSGAAWFDPDKDGDLDLLATTWQGTRNLYFRNEGDGSFVENAEAVGLDMASQTQLGGTSIAIGDYDLDGWPDVFIMSWLPSALPSGSIRSRLLRNQGTTNPGVFEDRTQEAGLQMAGAKLTPDDEVRFLGFAPAFVDLDDDDYPELIAVGDLGAEQLYRNGGDGTFEDVTASAGVGDTTAGMGLAVADLDSDGQLDYLVTSISGILESCDHWEGNPEGNRLYHNSGYGPLAFSIRDWQSRTTCGSWAWGIVASDIDNDGDVDLCQTNGFFGDAQAVEVYEQDTDRLWVNTGNPFDGMPECSQELGFDDDGQGRALVSVDYDEDGDLDYIETRAGDTPLIYRNEGGNARNHLRVSLRGTQGVTTGRGARIAVRATTASDYQIAQIGQASWFQGHGELTAHFGLGDNPDPVHELRVCWPVSKRMQVLSDLPSNTTVSVLESDADLEVENCAESVLADP
jgi:hypothetical protein